MSVGRCDYEKRSFNFKEEVSDGRLKSRCLSENQQKARLIFGSFSGGTDRCPKHPGALFPSLFPDTGPLQNGFQETLKIKTLEYNVLCGQGKIRAELVWVLAERVESAGAILDDQPRTVVAGRVRARIPC